jgi:hypothetical protein
MKFLIVQLHPLVMNHYAQCVLLIVLNYVSLFLHVNVLCIFIYLFICSLFYDAFLSNEDYIYMRCYPKVRGI